MHLDYQYLIVLVLISGCLESTGQPQKILWGQEPPKNTINTPISTPTQVVRAPISTPTPVVNQRSSMSFTELSKAMSSNGLTTLQRENLYLNKIFMSLENTIADLFPKYQFIPLCEVLATVNNATEFLDVFTHWQTTHIGSKPSAKTFYAGLTGLGCNIGIKKLGRISTNINIHELETTVLWYFTPENLISANDAILSFIDRLDLSKLFKKDQTRTHTSSDGQKYAVAGDSLNANYSFKYFGKGKGVTVKSFIDESFRLFFSTVFSSSEREAAYVFDGLLHNEVVKSDIHSTDTHGY